MTTYNLQRIHHKGRRCSQFSFSFVLYQSFSLSCTIPSRILPHTVPHRVHPYLLEYFLSLLHLSPIFKSPLFLHPASFLIVSPFIPSALLPLFFFPVPSSPRSSFSPSLFPFRHLASSPSILELFPSKPFFSSIPLSFRPPFSLPSCTSSVPPVLHRLSSSVPSLPPPTDSHAHHRPTSRQTSHYPSCPRAHNSHPDPAWCRQITRLR